MVLTCTRCGSDRVTAIYALGITTPSYLCLDCEGNDAVQRQDAEPPKRPTVGLLVYRQRKVERNLPPTAMEMTLTSTDVQDDLVALLRELEEGGC